MSSLTRKIDFAVVLRVKHANPNGDPLNGNRPRTDYNGYGEISDVCLKRKIRDRLQEAGFDIFVQSNDRKNDDATSLRDRAEKALGKKFDPAETPRLACEKWLDVRTFGHLFALPKKAKQKGAKDDSEEAGDATVSIPIRGPVTIHSAFSLQPIEMSSTQITKSVNSEGDGKKRGADTMGMKHRVDDSVYVFYGSMSPQLAKRTGFSDGDSEAVKAVLPKLFENDASSARPDGSMEVLRLIWWKHSSEAGQYSSAKVHRSLKVELDGECTLDPLLDLKPEQIPGF